MQTQGIKRTGAPPLTIARPELLKDGKYENKKRIYSKSRSRGGRIEERCKMEDTKKEQSIIAQKGTGKGNLKAWA